MATLCRKSLEQTIHFAANDDFVRITPADQASDCIDSKSERLFTEKPHDINARLRSLWRVPVQMQKVMMTWQHPMSTLSEGNSHKSSMRPAASSRWRMLPRKHVRFKGMMSPWMVMVISFLAQFFCSGGIASVWWDRVMAVVNAADFLMLPLSALARELIAGKEAWLHHYDRQAIDFAAKKHIFWSRTEIWLDAVYILDMFIRLVRACVLDLGFVESTADRLVDCAPKLAGDPASLSKVGPTVKEDAADLSIQIGPALRTQLFFSIPLRILLMLPMWVVHSMHHVSNVTITCAALARVYRLADLMAFFSVRQEDIATDVRWIAFCKFSFIIYSTV